MSASLVPTPVVFAADELPDALAEQRALAQALLESTGIV